jgi:hypothetical protein
MRRRQAEQDMPAPVADVQPPRRPRLVNLDPWLHMYAGEPRMTHAEAERAVLQDRMRAIAMGHSVRIVNPACAPSR